MTTEQLKSCPFCGSHNLSIGSSEGNNTNNSTFIRCNHCDARGSKRRYLDEAVLGWNMRVTHSLKILPKHFKDVASCDKKSEIRYNDRNYRVGDVLSLQEWSENSKNYSGSYINVRVTHILDNEKYLQKGYVMLSFEVLEVKS